VSKSKGKIPRINLLAVPPPELSSEDWGSLEAIYGYSIPFDTRQHILEATREFLKWAFAENTGSMKDAIQRTDRLRKQAQALVATIENRPIGDVTREYVDDELALSHDRLNDGKFARYHLHRASM
jgi:hypothetical protein